MKIFTDFSCIFIYNNSLKEAPPVYSPWSNSATKPGLKLNGTSVSLLIITYSNFNSTVIQTTISFPNGCILGLIRLVFITFSASLTTCTSPTSKLQIVSGSCVSRMEIICEQMETGEAILHSAWDLMTFLNIFLFNITINQFSNQVLCEGFSQDKLYWLTITDSVQFPDSHEWALLWFLFLQTHTHQCLYILTNKLTSRHRPDRPALLCFAFSTSYFTDYRYTKFANINNSSCHKIEISVNRLRKPGSLQHCLWFVKHLLWCHLYTLLALLLPQHMTDINVLKYPLWQSSLWWRVPSKCQEWLQPSKWTKRKQPLRQAVHELSLQLDCF